MRETRGRRTNLGNIQVTREETPVYVRTIPDVRVIVFCSSLLQDLLHQCLVAVGLFEEKLDNRGENLQLGLGLGICQRHWPYTDCYSQGESGITCVNSSMNPSTKLDSISSALLIFSAYSPTIQIREPLALGSSNSSMYWQSVGMTPS